MTLPGFLKHAFVASALALSSSPSCSDGDASTDSTRELRPRARGVAIAVDSQALARAFARAAELPRLNSLLVQWKGALVGEHYYHGTTPSTQANIKSASKSIISALVGIAIAEGKIRGIDQSIDELLPAATRTLEPVKRAITVGDLLSMRSGLQSTSFNNYGAWVSSRNWVADVLARPMVADAGGPMIYSTGSTHLLSAIITRSTGTDTHRFATRSLARPLGITIRPWQRDPQGIYFGGNDMYLTPRDMLKIGTLYLNRGMLDGKQIVPRAWVDSSLVPRTVSPFNGNRYGYGWWTRSSGGHDIHYAWGYGGQFIFVVPDLQLVVVATSDAESPRDGGHTGEIHRILEEEIIDSVSDRNIRD